MKIGIVSKFMPEKDGIAIYSENLCRELQKLCSVVKIGDEKSESADYKVNFTSFRLKQQLQRIIDKEKIELLHIQYIGAYFGRKTLNLNLLQALSQKIPVICTMHEVHYNYEGYNFMRKKVLAFLEKEIVKKSDTAIAHTMQQKQFLQRKYKAANVECIYHGLEIVSSKKTHDKKILFFGKISRKKGLEILIKAMKMLPDFKLKIVGSFTDKKHEAQIRKMTANAPNITTRFGWVSNDERWKHFREADIVALPYIQAQYQSGTLHNAVSAGLPVVVTRTGALHEMVEQFKFGEIADRTPETIAEGIKKATANYDEYKKGLEAYRKEANWKTVAEKHAELYEKIIRNNEQGA